MVPKIVLLIPSVHTDRHVFLKSLYTSSWTWVSFTQQRFLAQFYHPERAALQWLRQQKLPKLAHNSPRMTINSKLIQVIYFKDKNSSHSLYFLILNKIEKKKIIFQWLRYNVCGKNLTFFVESIFSQFGNFTLLFSLFKATGGRKSFKNIHPQI